MSYHITSYHTIPNHAIPYHIIPYHIISLCHVISYHTLLARETLYLTYRVTSSKFLRAAQLSIPYPIHIKNTHTKATKRKATPVSLVDPLNIERFPK